MQLLRALLSGIPTKPSKSATKIGCASSTSTSQSAAFIPTPSALPSPLSAPTSRIKFWVYHDLLFENQRNLSQEALIGYARGSRRAEHRAVH